MRLIVKGFMEPPEWDGKTDSPTAMSSTIRQLIAMGKAEVIGGDQVLYMDINDVISIGDISTAFLFGKEYGPDDTPRYVKYKPYPGAYTRVFQLRGCLYGEGSTIYMV